MSPESQRAVLETPRLLLRELGVEDLDFIAELLGDPLVMRYWPRPYTREEAAEWIRRQQQRYARDGHGYWLAVEKASGQPVGQVGLLTPRGPSPPDRARQDSNLRPAI